MPAQSEKQLFNFENNFERAAAARLAANGYHAAFIQGASAELPSSRIEVTFATGEALNEAILPNGDPVYDFCSGRLTVRVVTVRPDEAVAAGARFSAPL